MYWCFPHKCELCSLSRFINHFNEQEGTNYTVSMSPEAIVRSNSQPELLLESPNRKPMVIERKSLRWPSDYLDLHGQEHIFMDHIIEILSPKFQDDLYVLEISADHVHRRKQDIKKLSSKIACLVISSLEIIRTYGEFHSYKPVPWYFRRIPEYERDWDMPNKGVGVNLNLGFNFNDETSLEEVRSVILQQLANVFDAARKKFNEYSHCLRIVVLEVYSMDISLPEGSIDDLIQGTEVPSCIDQIWLSNPEWVSEYEWQPEYRQVWMNKLC